MSTRNFDIIIGGSSEIGIAIIRKLILNGRNVLYTYHSNNSILSNMKAFSKDKPGLLIPFKLDVNSDQDIDLLSSYISSENIRISSLTYNAGKTNDLLFNSMTEKDFTDIMNVNLTGCFRVCKALVNNLAINQGSMVFISSVSGLVGKIGQVNYSCSKAAIIALCRNLAREYAGMGVRANCIAPGLIKTKMLDKMPEINLKAIKKDIPLKRIGLPNDVANAVFFLTSDESAYITGQTLVVDGGLVMR